MIISADFLIMKQERILWNNWVNRVREFREYLDKFQYSDTEDNLLQFEKELEKIANKTLKIYAEETL